MIKAVGAYNTGISTGFTLCQCSPVLSTAVCRSGLVFSVYLLFFLLFLLLRGSLCCTFFSRLFFCTLLCCFLLSLLLGCSLFVLLYFLLCFILLCRLSWLCRLFFNLRRLHCRSLFCIFTGYSDCFARKDEVGGQVVPFFEI